MELLKFTSSNPETNLFINKEFQYNGKTFLINKITKTWGKNPVFLGYCSAVTDDNCEEFFQIKCVCNIHSKEEKDNWVFSLSKE